MSFSSLSDTFTYLNSAQSCQYGITALPILMATIARTARRGAVRMPTGALLLVMFLVSIAGAERELPTAIDLRAAYCIQIVQHQIAVIQPSATDLKFADDMAALLAEANDNLRRLQLYLLPRFRHLEPLGLTTAMQRAKEDMATSEQHVKACDTTCRQKTRKNTSAEVACVEQCVKRDNPVRPRINECEDLRWLPS